MDYVFSRQDVGCGCLCVLKVGDFKYLPTYCSDDDIQQLN